MTSLPPPEDPPGFRIHYTREKTFELFTIAEDRLVGTYATRDEALAAVWTGEATRP